jgi:hypothetical protein
MILIVYKKNYIKICYKNQSTVEIISKKLRLKLIFLEVLILTKESVKWKKYLICLINLFGTLNYFFKYLIFNILFIFLLKLFDVRCIFARIYSFSMAIRNNMLIYLIFYL